MGMADIAVAFANKTFQLVVGLLALAAIILIPVTVYQTVQINGFLWWGGLKQKAVAAETARADAVHSLLQCQSNELTLKDALARQSAAVQALKAQSAAQKAEADKAVAAALARAKAADAKLAAFLAHKPVGATSCARAEDTDAWFRGVIQ